MNIIKKLFTGTDGKSRYLLIGILALAFVIRLGVLFGFTDFNSSFSEDPYPQITTYLLDGQGISKDYGTVVKPITTHGPLYPLFSAGLLIVSGRSWLAVRLAQLLLSMGSVLLIFHIGRRALGVNAGLVSAALMAVYLPLARFSADLMTETLFTFLIIMIIYLAFRLVREWSGLLSIFLGIVLGLLILTKIKGIFIAFLFLPLLLIIGRRRRRPLVWAVVPFLLAMVVYSPWVVRNSMIEHTFVPLGSGFGDAIIQGQDQPAASSGNAPSPDLSNETAGQRSDYLFKRAVDYIFKKPGTFVAQSGQRFLEFWFNLGFDSSPSKSSILFALANFLALAAGLAGVFMLLRRAGPGRDLAILTFSMAAVFTAVHMGTLAVGRYSVPILPLVFLMAPVSLSWLYSRIKGRAGSDGKAEAQTMSES